MAVDLKTIQMIPASHHGPQRIAKTDVIIIHDMENNGNIKEGGALECAHFFASQGSPYQAHYTVDPSAIYQCVPLDTVAYHVGNGNIYDNDVSIGIEQTGAAANSREEWLSEMGTRQIKLVGELTGALCDNFNIPKVLLSVEDIQAGRRGITSHANMAKALGGSDHTDPGPDYPWDVFIASVLGAPAPMPVLQGVNMVAAARNADGRLEEFKIGSDGCVYNRWQLAPNSDWSKGLQKINDGKLDASEGISAAVNADGRIEIFAVSVYGVDVHMWQNQSAVSGWSDWAVFA